MVKAKHKVFKEIFKIINSVADPDEGYPDPDSTLDDDFFLCNSCLIKIVKSHLRYCYDFDQKIFRKVRFQRDFRSVFRLKPDPTL